MNSIEKNSAVDLLCIQLKKLQKQAAAIGLFTGDRELLECTNCGLVEDVLIDGRLVTYRKTARNIDDCSLRFHATENDIFVCPKCNALAKETHSLNDWRP